MISQHNQVPQQFVESFRSATPRVAEEGLLFDFQQTQRVRKPVARGLIKSSVEDFIVEEELEFEPAGTGEHLFLLIEKSGVNTGWVADQLSAYFNIRKMDVGFAGRKDRQAVTRQWFSCYLPGNNKVYADPKGFNLEGVRVLSVARHEKKLRKGELAGNLFRIRVRDIKPLDSEAGSAPAINQLLEGRLKNLMEEGFPNYFGEQRFGINGENLIRALEYFDCCINIRKEASGAGRRSAGKKIASLRRRLGKSDLYLSAARSWLFNIWLNQEILSGRWSDLANGSGPLYGDGDDRSVYPQGVCQQLCEGLDEQRVKSGIRKARVLPERLSWEIDSESEKEACATIVLEFFLPSGSYATSFLRELFLYQSPGIPESGGLRDRHE